MPVSVIILLILEVAFSFFLLKREKLLSSAGSWSVAGVCIILVFLLRLLCFNHETYDYIDWISRWISYFREDGAWYSLGQELWACNYNVPYLYVLAIFSCIDLYDLYLVKLFSVFFDILLAYWSMKLVGLLTNCGTKKLICFLGTLWLPTFFLNGALWGQCDSVYVAFAVLSIYLVLDDRPIGGIIAIAVSFSIKLQAIFIMPVYLIFLFAKKLKWYHLPVFPLTYIVMILPAVIAGRNFLDLLLLYWNNTSSIGEGLNYNSSSLYSITSFLPLSEASASGIGIVLAFSFCAVLFLWAFLRRTEFSNLSLFAFSVLFCIGIPFLLPHMHDRYFALADIFSFMLAVICPWETVCAALVSFGSLLGYHAYLKMQYLMPMRFGGYAMAISLLLSLVFAAKSFTFSDANTDIYSSHTKKENSFS